MDNILIKKYMVGLILGLLISLSAITATKAKDPEDVILPKTSSPTNYTQPQTFVVEMFWIDKFGVLQEACKKNSMEYGCGDEDHPYPNDTNDWEVNIEDFYMPNTLPEEVNAAPLPALESVAVAIRSYALHLDYYGTDSWHLDNTVRRQVFAPYSLKATDQTNQAVENTREVFLACGSNCPQSRQGYPAFAEHSAAHPGYFTTATTDLTNHPYLDETYDPIYSQDNNGHGRGLAQQSAIQLALGIGQDGTPYPPLDYCHILAHLYTGVNFNCTKTASPTPTNQRFTFIYLGGLDNQEDDPLRWERGTSQQLGFIIQNTGDTPFTLTPQANCNPQNYEQRTLAIGLHWYSYLDYNMVEFEGSRIVLCEEVVNGVIRTTIAPGEVYPAQTSTPSALFGSVWVPETLSAGLYWLRLDVEFLPPHLTLWGSRLDPTTNTENARWSTQDIVVQVLPAPFNIPQEPVVDSVSPAPILWSNDNAISLTWHNDDTIDHYLYAWQHQDNFEGWQSTTATTLNQTRPDGQTTFYLQAVNAGGEVSEVLELGPWLIDSVPPTITLTTLASVITNPHTTNISFSWFASDDSQSPLSFDIAYATAPQGAEPPPIPFDPDLMGLTSTSLSLSDLGLTLTPNTTYYVWVRGHDEAGNISHWLEQQISYQPAPLLSVKPNQILLTTLTTNTTPITLPLSIYNEGGGQLAWQATNSFSYTQLSHYMGIATSTTLLTITHPTTIGNYTYPITFTGPLTSYNSPYLLPVRVRVMMAIYPIYMPLLFK